MISSSIQLDNINFCNIQSKKIEEYIQQNNIIVDEQLLIDLSKNIELYKLSNTLKKITDYFIKQQNNKTMKNKQFFVITNIIFNKNHIGI